MPSPRATLGGVPLTAVQDFSWTFQPGVRAHRRTFETDAAGARAIYAQGGPITYEVEIPGYAPLKVEHIYPLSLQPGSTPHTLGVRVADRRILWTYRFMARDYNARRRMGDRRIITEGNLANFRAAPDIWYWHWSLNRGSPWTAEDMLRDVLDYAGIPYTMPADFKRKIEVEDLELQGRMDRMVGRALAYLAGYECWLDETGRLIIYDVWDGIGTAGAGLVSTVPRDGGAAPPSHSPWGPVIVGSGFVRRVDRAKARPRRVLVGFVEEAEIRFNYTEGVEQRTSTLRITPGERPPRVLENVMASPDVSLEVTSGGRTRTVGQGSWITLQEAFDSWPTSSYPTSPTAPEPFSHKVARLHWLRNFSDLENLYARGAGGAIEPVWVQRISAVRRHWRQTFRITRPWMGKIRSVRAHRAALLDHENGIRAASLCYCDWLAKADLHTYARRVSEYHRLGWEVRGYSDLLSACKAAPAVVAVIDGEQGVIHFGFHRDAAGQAHEIAPGRPPDGVRLPTSNYAATEVVWSQMALNESWSACTVLTCTRAVPNDKERLHWIVVTPSDAERVLGNQIGECAGVDQVEIHVSGGRLTARFGWDDAKSEQIESSFFDGVPMPVELLVNDDEITAIAQAEAARYYAAAMDRLEGTCAVPWNPTIRIEGSMSAVTHTLHADGRALTWIALAPKLEPLDEMAFIPSGIQRVIRRMVQP